MCRSIGESTALAFAAEFDPSMIDASMCGFTGQDVEDPVDCVEEDEGDGEDDARVLVDHIHVLDLGDGGLEYGRALLEGVHHLGPMLPLRRVAATAPEPQSPCRAHGDRVAGRARPEAGRELGGVHRRFAGGGSEPVVVSVADGGNGGHAQVLQFDDLLVGRGRGEAVAGGGPHRGRAPSRGRFRNLNFLFINFLSFFSFLLCSSSPIGVIHGSVFQQGGKHKHETHHQVDVDSFHVRNARQGAPNSCADGSHGQYSCYAESNSGAGRFVIDPKGDPRQHDDEDGGEIRLEDKITDITL